MWGVDNVVPRGRWAADISEMERVLNKEGASVPASSGTSFAAKGSESVEAVLFAYDEALEATDGGADVEVCYTLLRLPDRFNPYDVGRLSGHE